MALTAAKTRNMTNQLGSRWPPANQATATMTIVASGINGLSQSHTDARCSSSSGRIASSSFGTSRLDLSRMSAAQRMVQELAVIIVRHFAPAKTRSAAKTSAESHLR